MIRQLVGTTKTYPDLGVDSSSAMESDGLLKKGLVVGQLKPNDVCRKHRPKSPSPSGSSESAFSLDLMTGHGCGNTVKKSRNGIYIEGSSKVGKVKSSLGGVSSSSNKGHNARAKVGG